MLIHISKSNRLRFAGFTLLASLGLLLLPSCASDQPPLIADPNGSRDSSLPWNQQQKWEQGGGQVGELNTAGRR